MQHCDWSSDVCSSDLTISDRTTENRKRPFRRDKPFQNHSETLHPFLCTVIVTIRCVPNLTFTSICHDFQRFYIHRMQNKTIIIVKSKTRTIGVPTIAYVPLFYFTQSGNYAVSITWSACFTQECFDRSRKQQPICVRRIYSAKLCKLSYITLFRNTKIGRASCRERV